MTKEALRFNEGKPKLGYFARSFPWMQECVARVKEFGANKYEDGNWRLGAKPDEEYLDSLARHMAYFLGGEFYDDDSGCAHLGHAVWNLCALAELNYGNMPTIDEKKFRERMAYWAEKKAETTGKVVVDKTLKFVIKDGERSKEFDSVIGKMWQKHMLDTLKEQIAQPPYDHTSPKMKASEVTCGGQGLEDIPEGEEV